MTDFPKDMSLMVSCHAVTRYVQRILGITVEGRFTGPRAQADAHCAAAELTVEAVRGLIMTPVVELACRSGLARARGEDFIAKICDGTVTTIVEVRRFKPVRVKSRSNKEDRRAAHQKARRNKGRAWA